MGMQGARADSHLIVASELPPAELIWWELSVGGTCEMIQTLCWGARRWLALPALGWLCLALWAGEAAVLPLSPLAAAIKFRTVKPVPGYVFDIEDGLYATIATERFPKPKIVHEKKTKLKPEGFAKDIEVRVLWAARGSPLVVLIPGLLNSGSDKEIQLWMAYLHDAGFHVLTFDSPFLPSFNDRSRHGVGGNLREEAKVVASLIQAFLDHPKTKGRVTQLGLVGLSYGGTLALNIARLAAENRVSIHPQRILAFSPPVKMQTASRILDGFYAENRWDYTLLNLARDLSDLKPVSKGQPVPFCVSEMRAGIGAMFRVGLADVVIFDDRVYELGRLPDGHDDYRRDVAETWTFVQFMEGMALPYWSQRTTCSAAEFWAAGDLAELVKACPDTVHVIMTADDPLNDPMELEEFLESVNVSRRTILPHGGHLGYANTEWVKVRIAKLFP